jgi:hypothetical protein
VLVAFVACRCESYALIDAKTAFGFAVLARRVKEWHEEQEEAKKGSSAAAPSNSAGAAAAFTPGKLSVAEQKRLSED